MKVVLGHPEYPAIPTGTPARILTLFLVSLRRARGPARTPDLTALADPVRRIDTQTTLQLWAFFCIMQRVACPRTPVPEPLLDSHLLPRTQKRLRTGLECTGLTRRDRTSLRERARMCIARIVRYTAAAHAHWDATVDATAMAILGPLLCARPLAPLAQLLAHRPERLVQQCLSTWATLPTGRLSRTTGSGCTRASPPWTTG